MKVAVIGSGSWGTALANIFADAKCTTTLWGRHPEQLKEITETHENKKYLKGFPLNKELLTSPNLAEAVEEADWIVCGIPTQQIRKVFTEVAPLLKGKVILNASKGIELGTHSRVSQIFASLSKETPYAILSGPSFAQEVVARLPAAVTIACSNSEIGARIQKALSTPYFRTYRSQDVVGVELAGALKNVVAIASGVVAGLNLGYNAQAALINRGIVEIARLAKKLGAQPYTFLGLSGVGDLILTCTGPLSRNRRLGILLGQGKKWEEAKSELGGVAEGYYTAKSALELAENLRVEMPIAEQVYRMLYEGQNAKTSVAELMSRDLKEEWETV